MVLTIVMTITIVMTLTITCDKGCPGVLATKGMVPMPSGYACRGWSPCGMVLSASGMVTGRMVDGRSISSRASSSNESSTSNLPARPPTKVNEKDVPLFLDIPRSIRESGQIFLPTQKYLAYPQDHLAVTCRERAGTVLTGQHMSANPGDDQHTLTGRQQ
jgi:hypothetical protein